MRSTYLSLTLVALLSCMYSPAYGVELPSKYVVSNCKINMLSEPIYNSKGTSWIGMTTIGGCKAGELASK